LRLGTNNPTRKKRGDAMMTLWQDLRYGVRMLLRSPGVSVIAVFALALGIGANTAIFSVVNAVLVRQLPYENPERLVLVWERFLRQGLEQVPVSAPEYTEYREQNKSFEQIAAFDTVDFNLTGSDDPERVPGASAAASLFSLLGVKPELGRTFAPEENEAGRDTVVVVSHGLWQRRFGSDPNLVGRMLQLNGRSYTIIGVMPPKFNFPLSLFGIKGVQFTQPAELWTPLVFTPAQMKSRGSRGLGIIGRLKPGVTLAQASAEVQSIANHMRERYPDSYPPDGWGASAVSLHEQVIGSIRPTLYVLLGAVGLVLLISCTNVANLLLARAAARQQEMAIRTALGAVRRRIIRQLLTESILLGLIGGGCGLVLAMWGIDLLAAYGAQTLPRISEVNLDARVLGFTFLISILTGAIFGLAPALTSSKLDLNESLKEGGRSSTSGVGHKRLRSVTIIAEFALALVLLIAAGLLIKSFWRLQQVDPGFNPNNVLTFQLSLPRDKYPENQQVAAFYQHAIEHIKALPGVTSAGAATILPLSGSNSDQSFVIEGRIPQGLSAIPDEELRTVTPDYFRTMNIPLLKGRYFTDSDVEKAPQVVIINQALARKYFSGEEALGKRMTVDDPRKPDAEWVTIVGVVGDVRHNGLNIAAKPEWYAPHLQNPRRTMVLVARTASADPTSITASIRRSIAEMDKDLPVYNTRTMERVIAELIAPQRLSTFLLGIFATLALALASIGIYGVMSYTVTQRTHEIGIRLALGARNTDVLKLIVKQGMTLAMIGVGVGLIGAFAVTRVMASLLYGVSAIDPVIFSSVALLLATVALVACLVPARRATKVDPMIALRSE
jgi:putative ABC transport system permease protein